MAFKGYGVSRINGKVVFIPYSVSGDEAEIEIIEDRKNHSIGRIKRLIKPSPYRVNPLCSYFGKCGGCHWQHIDYPFQQKLKIDILKDILNRIGGLKETPAINIFPSPDIYGYRLRIQLKIKDNLVGYYKERSHEIIDIEQCPISHPLVNSIIKSIREIIPFLPKAEGFEIRVSPYEGKGVVVFKLHSLSHNKDNLFKNLQGNPFIKGLVGIYRGRDILWGDTDLKFKIDLNPHGRNINLTFRVSPESFFQVNLKQNLRLINTILEFLEGEKNVLDLYSGVGNITLPLAMVAKEVTGVEENPFCIEDAIFNAKNNSIDNCEWIKGRVDDILPNLKKGRFDLITLDPPRAGCLGVLEEILGLGAKRIIYISCEPTTFSRDLGLIIKSNYRLKALNLIDMFPQTYHMELVGLLSL